MKIVLAYITVTGGPQTEHFASRFIASYKANPPGEDHETIVVGNGGPPSWAVGLMLSDLPGFRVYPRQNDGGWDISAYIELARGPAAGADLMLCFGESIYFHKPGWLSRLARARTEWGRGIFGAFASNTVRPHINTTGFATDPDLLARYPLAIHDKQSRYEFEHGARSFWRTVNQSGFPALLVTWDGEYEPRRWRHPRNILWRGDQSNCLFFCQHTDRYIAADLYTQQQWRSLCDAPYQ